MTSYYVSMSTKHLKLLESLSTSSCVNLVTIALTVLKLHRGASETPPPPLPVGEGSKKPGLYWVKPFLEHKQVVSMRSKIPLTVF